jgi:hypothetical protein
METLNGGILMKKLVLITLTMLAVPATLGAQIWTVREALEHAKTFTRDEHSLAKIRASLELASNNFGRIDEIAAQLVINEILGIDQRSPSEHAREEQERKEREELASLELARRLAAEQCDEDIARRQQEEADAALARRLMEQAPMLRSEPVTTHGGAWRCEL